MDTSNLRAFGTKNKFCLCYGIHDLNIKTAPESFYSQKGIDVQAFKRLVLKTEFEEYSDLLLAKYWMSRESKGSEKSIEISIIENTKMLKEITGTLITLLSNSTKRATITFQKSHGIVETKNIKIIDVIIRALKELLLENPITISRLSTEENAASYFTPDDVTLDKTPKLTTYRRSKLTTFLRTI
jgi:hypothetical protein